MIHIHPKNLFPKWYPRPKQIASSNDLISRTSSPHISSYLLMVSTRSQAPWDALRHWCVSWAHFIACGGNTGRLRLRHDGTWWHKIYHDILGYIAWYCSILQYTVWNCFLCWPGLATVGGFCYVQLKDAYWTSLDIIWHHMTSYTIIWHRWTREIHGNSIEMFRIFQDCSGISRNLMKSICSSDLNCSQDLLFTDTHCWLEVQSKAEAVSQGTRHHPWVGSCGFLNEPCLTQWSSSLYIQVIEIETW